MQSTELDLLVALRSVQLGWHPRPTSIAQGWNQRRAHLSIRKSQRIHHDLPIFSQVFQKSLPPLFAKVRQYGHLEANLDADKIERTGWTLRDQSADWSVSWLPLVMCRGATQKPEPKDSIFPFPITENITTIKHPKANHCARESFYWLCDFHKQKWANLELDTNKFLEEAAPCCRGLSEFIQARIICSPDWYGGDAAAYRPSFASHLSAVTRRKCLFQRIPWVPLYVRTYPRAIRSNIPQRPTVVVLSTQPPGFISFCRPLLKNRDRSKPSHGIHFRFCDRDHTKSFLPKSIRIFVL